MLMLRAKLFFFFFFSDPVGMVTTVLRGVGKSHGSTSEKKINWSKFFPG